MKKTKENLLIGAHLQFSSSTNYFVGLINELIRSGGNTAAFFPGPPQSKIIPIISKENIDEGKKIAKENGIDIKQFVAHSRYIINMANPTKAENRLFSIDLMVSDTKTLDSLGVGYFNFHPGSSLGMDSDLAINFLIDSINILIEKTSTSDVVYLIESMMSKGNYIGKNFEQLSKIIKGVKNKERIGICLDTCHIWDGGYDIKNQLEGVLNDFDTKIGLKYLKAIHINDSKNDINTHKDRHENLGKGFLGIDFFKKLTVHPKLNNLPFIIETPWIDKKTPAYYDEINYLKKTFFLNKK